MSADPIQLLEKLVAALRAMEADETDNDDSAFRMMEIGDQIDNLSLDGPAAACAKLYAFLVQAETAFSEGAGLDFAGARKALQMLLPQRERAPSEELAPLAA